MTEEKLDFTRRFLILGNLALLGWIFLAFFNVLFYNFLYSWLYLVFLTFMVYAVLRRLGCSSCYKCKSCTSGFGRLAGSFFGRGLVKKESVGNRLWLVALIYFLLLVLPTVLVLISLFHAFFYGKVLALATLWAVSMYSVATWFNCSTATTKM